MTDTTPRPRRTLLPLAAGSATGSWQTCKWKCGYSCWHEPPNTSDNETFEQVVARALSRRDFLRTTLVLSAAAGVSTVGVDVAAAAGPKGKRQNGPDHRRPKGGLGFTPIAPSTADEVIVPDGYVFEILLKWGDPLFPRTPEFDVTAQTPERQARQFGYNNDFVAFLPLSSRRNSESGLLWVNHEYVNPTIMFPDFDEAAPTEDQVNVIMNAVGGTVAELKRGRSRLFAFNKRSRYNRRITLNTPMRITGPAAGHPLMQTPEDPSGTRVNGTMGNCAGGRTPWGTILTAEENFQDWFANSAGVDFDALDNGEFVRRLTERYGITEGATAQGLELYHDRFDMSKVVNENHRFGYIVEIDPYDPRSTPKKRTALGRMKHECATYSIAKDRRVAFYMGDDEQFDYVYKFVTSRPYSKRNRHRNADLLDDGTLYVAKFDVDGDGHGIGTWIPLVAGEGPLTADNGFPTQAEVCIGARLAADLLGATKMDRPEDVQRNPVTGGLYINLTNNVLRGVDDNPPVDPANPRPANAWGHVIELFEAGDDAAATDFTWDLFLVCGDPDDPSTYFAGFPRERVSPISCPDNLAFDNAGNIIIATDGQPSSIGLNDAFHFVPAEGRERGHVQQFLSVPVGAEACGPELTPDNETLFCAVQHPGDGGSFESPTSTWPDREVPPRPSLVNIVKRRGGVIGS